MSTSGKDKLLSLLFDEGRELVNLRFFPGKEDTSEEEFCNAAHEMISRALTREGEGVIPTIEGKQHSIGELVSAT